jgi:hypothetical protein
VAQLRELQLGLELVLVRGDVQHGRHPPGQVSGPPDPLQAVVGVRGGELGVTVADEPDQRRRQGRDVGDREVEALIATGSPEDVAANDKSYTSQFLKPLLAK